MRFFNATFVIIAIVPDPDSGYFRLPVARLDRIQGGRELNRFATVRTEIVRAQPPTCRCYFGPVTPVGRTDYDHRSECDKPRTFAPRARSRENG